MIIKTQDEANGNKDVRAMLLTSSSHDIYHISLQMTWFPYCGMKSLSKENLYVEVTYKGHLLIADIFFWRRAVGRQKTSLGISFIKTI